MLKGIYFLETNSSVLSDTLRPTPTANVKAIISTRKQERNVKKSLRK